MDENTKRGGVMKERERREQKKMMTMTKEQEKGRERPSQIILSQSVKDSMRVRNQWQIGVRGRRV